MSTQLSILVPVYNEERTLETIMASIVDACPDAQIIYVDDESRDSSLAILQRKARPRDLVIPARHGGKGSAIRTGLARAEGTYTIIQDADLEYDPHQIHLLLEEAMAHPGSAVFGSRFLQENPNIYRRFLFGNKFLTACMNVLFHSHLTDTYTCYKLMPTEVWRRLPLTASGFELEAEICALALRSGIPIREVPIHYHPRTILEGKKINWRDAVKGLRTMLRLRFAGQH